MNDPTSDLAAAPLATPDQARANARLGLLLGALVVAVIITFICVFTRGGLPRDPGVWRRMQLEQSSSGAQPEDPVGGAPAPTSLAPAPATPAPAQEPQQ